MTATKVGGEFLVNTDTAGSQTEPTITGLGNGGFVISWGGFGSAKAQVFSANGVKVGSEFLVASGGQPTITTLANGHFAITWWTSKVLDDGTNGIVSSAQIFSADGAKVGSDFIVSTQRSDMIDGDIAQTVSGLSNGGLVVAW